MLDAEGHSASYGVREAAQLVGLSPERVRRFVRAGLVEPRRTARGQLRLSFRDLSFLRRVRDLDRARIAPRRVHRALTTLRAQLDPAELAALSLDTAVGQVVVREGGNLWSPESGQCVFDFETRRDVPALVSMRRPSTDRRRGMSADEWYQLGCELESGDRERAHQAYRLAVEADPEHADARVNLGCMEHENGAFEAAEAHYREALALRPDDATARFNLAVLLEDQGRLDAAQAVYGEALSADPACAEAHYNLARLCECVGDTAGALRHLTAYRRLSRD